MIECISNEWLNALIGTPLLVGILIGYTTYALLERKRNERLK